VIYNPPSMKRSLLCHLSLGLAVLSAEPVQDDSQTATILPDPAAIRFTPPPPPKDVPPISVKGSTTADFGTHRITILRGEASTLPDIPKPPPPVEQSREVALEPSEPHYVFFISGSTYSDSLSDITVWNPITGTSHKAWCGWDVSLLAPFHEFTHEGKFHTLFMGVSRVAALETADADTRQHPEVKPGSILVPDGDEYTAAILTSMRDACFQNMPKLLELKAAREQYQKDSDAWKAANPQRPQNHTIWIKPHRGSRYLKKTHNDQQEGPR
jgi:hypothetical protein